MKRRAYNRDRGIALVTTVWIVLFLALTAATIVTTTRTDSSARRNAADLVAARELARAGVHTAIHDLSLAVADRVIPRDGTPVAYRLGDGTVTLQVEDERGKLDLRIARSNHVQALLMTLGKRQGVDAFDASTLARRITSELEVTRAGDNRSSRIHSLSALANLPGMPRGLIAELERHATVFGFGAEVNPLYASRETLLAIDGVAPGVADQIIAARRDGRPRPAAGSAEQSFTTLEGPVYTIRSTGRLGNGISATVTAVVGNEGIGIASRQARITVLEYR
jgi:hypothetical protein